MTVVLTSHTLAEAERICDRVAILDEGRVRLTGRTNDLRRSAGDTVTVQFRTGEVDALSRETERLRDAPTVRGVERLDDERIRIRCTRDDAFDVITAVHERVPVDGFEVREPNLDDVFRDAVTPTTDTSPRPPAAGQQGGDRP